MEIENIKRKKADKRICVTIKVTKEISDWLKQNNISPTKLFLNAIEELKEKNHTQEIERRNK